jgi:hypothetical protein
MSRVSERSATEGLKTEQALISSKQTQLKLRVFNEELECPNSIKFLNNGNLSCFFYIPVLASLVVRQQSESRIAAVGSSPSRDSLTSKGA